MTLNKPMNILMLFILIQMSGIFASAQQNNQPEDEIKLINIKTYEKVLDIVFPRDTLSGSFGYGFVLRFKPSFDAESQINIENDLGQIQVVEYYSQNGNIYDQLSRLRRTGKEPPEELAKQIRIQKRVLKILPSIVKQWRESFYQNLALASNYERKNINENMQQSTTVDDGTAYLIWYHGATDIFYELNGGPGENSPINSSENALVKWMKNVRTKIRSIK